VGETTKDTKTTVNAETAEHAEGESIDRLAKEQKRGSLGPTVVTAEVSSVRIWTSRRKGGRVRVRAVVGRASAAGPNSPL